MTTVLLGSNKFTDCRTIIGIDGDPVLQISTSPLHVSFKTPRKVPSELAVEIVENEPRKGPAGLQIVSHDKNSAVLLGEYSLILATLLDEGTAHLKLDLRPLGLLIYDDPEGLHVGKNVLARNAFMGCSTAIALD
ncbi:MAG TPA: hypothetical protein DCM87_21225 [Planctomycetes bacterium]|jgi:hypothetical protein|nr:hypothetical protein [Planctomycetota bacterium]